MKNEKGSTLVETVMTLSMLMIIMLSMTTLIISLKKTDKRTKETKEITEYKNNISRIINDDLILLKLKFKYVANVFILVMFGVVK